MIPFRCAGEKAPAPLLSICRSPIGKLSSVPGLAVRLALSLIRAGFEVTVLEQASRLGVGAGIRSARMVPVSACPGPRGGARCRRVPAGKGRDASLADRRTLITRPLATPVSSVSGSPTTICIAPIFTGCWRVPYVPLSRTQCGLMRGSSRSSRTAKACVLCWHRATSIRAMY